MERFNASLPYDKRMWRQDIEGSIAYASALGRAGLLSSQEVSLIFLLRLEISLLSLQPTAFVREVRLLSRICRCLCYTPV